MGRSEAEGNLAKHGLDFADAYLVYENPRKVTFESRRSDESRMLDLALVEIAGTVLALVYIEREKQVRIISFRRPSRIERKKYAEITAK